MAQRLAIPGGARQTPIFIRFKNCFDDRTQHNDTQKKSKFLLLLLTVPDKRRLLTVPDKRRQHAELNHRHLEGAFGTLNILPENL